MTLASDHRSSDLAKIAKLEQFLCEKDEELQSLHHKLSETRTSKGQIFEDVQMLEENLSQMQDTIQNLRKQLSDKTKEIETLEYELNCYRQQGKNMQELMENRRKNGEVISGLKEKEREMDGQLEILTDNLRNLKRENHELVQKIASFEREKQSLLDTNESLRSQIADLSAELKLSIDQTKRVKEDTKHEMMSRIVALKQEKLAVETRLRELQDFIDVQKRSILDAPSLMEELAQLEDVSSPKIQRNNEKQVESLTREIEEKDLFASFMQSENEKLKGEIGVWKEKWEHLSGKSKEMEAEMDALRKETARLQERVLATEAKRLQHSRNPSEVDLLQGEIKRLQAELLLSKEIWGEENNNLRSSLQDAEKIAVEATAKYAEAAADRDTFMKKYRDLVRDRERRSTKY